MSDRDSHTQSKVEVAWSCRDCGHMLSRSGTDEPTGKCPQCKKDPARWNSASVTHGPVDQDVAAVANYSRDEVAGNDPAGLFATSAPGVEGEDINPELRVRY